MTMGKFTNKKLRGPPCTLQSAAKRCRTKTETRLGLIFAAARTVQKGKRSF